MGFIKQARPNQLCADCRFFNRADEVCEHPEMKGEKVTADMNHKCESKYFKSKDDFETSGR
ncbi:MAG: hypothetical protein PHE88_02370 [Elusimicrobia bacterium]|nr:hypothetical protein [Elusimicrobiota bacterium]